ncbi:MAG: dihydroorotate dehydrogenase electron transfer subunit [Acetanaerobacterium sp.]
MNYMQGVYQIYSCERLTGTTYSFVVRCEKIAGAAKAGQFAHVRIPGFMLRRPISICEVLRDIGCIRLVFDIRGAGTQTLAHCEAGCDVDLLAPLGNGFDLLDGDKKAIVIGGGIGVPPLLEIAKHYGKNACAVMGFKNAEAVILQEDFAAAGSIIRLCTDDGSMGEKGFVTPLLERELKAQKTDIIYACGPRPMLKAVQELAARYGVRCQLSLEERMACGVGACLGCACKTKKNGVEGYSHVCKDGPVFEAEEVVFDE